MDKMQWYHSNSAVVKAPTVTDVSKDVSVEIQFQYVTIVSSVSSSYRQQSAGVSPVYASTGSDYLQRYTGVCPTDERS